MVFQNYALFLHLTVMENIQVALHANLKDQEQHIQQLLEQVNLSGLQHRY